MLFFFVFFFFCFFFPPMSVVPCPYTHYWLIMTYWKVKGGLQLQIIRILNHFGSCASSDTSQIYLAQSKVNEQFKFQSFTIVSAGNIDFQLSFTRVFCGKQTSSRHGTSIQAVQLFKNQCPWSHETFPHRHSPKLTSECHGPVPRLYPPLSTPVYHGPVPSLLHPRVLQTHPASVSTPN